MFKLTGQKFRKKEVNKKKYFHNLALTFSELQKGGIAMRKLLLLALAVFALTVVLLLTFAVPAMARPPNTAMTAMAANSQTSLDLSVVVSRGISVPMPMPMATARNGPGILMPTAMAANDSSSELLSLIAEAQTQKALNANRLNYGGLIGLPGALGYTSTFTLTDSPMIQRRSIGSLPVCVPVAYLNGLGQRQAQSAAYYNSMNNICMAATARGNTTHTITGKSTVLRL